MSRVAVIGSGFSGLSAACYMAKAGHEVHVFEKNNEAGGRAWQLKTDNGFVFDIEPSWYWMPDVYEKFFGNSNHKVSDFYQLQLLQPAFDIAFGKNEVEHIPQNFEQLCLWLEQIERARAEQLKKSMHEAEFKYKTGMEKLVYKPRLSVIEFVNAEVIAGLFRLQIFSLFSTCIRKYFSNEKFLLLMELPVLFLRAEQSPALYSLMNYAGSKLGTGYPQGRFVKVVDTFVELAKSLGLKFHFNAPVEKINTAKNAAVSISVNGFDFSCDGVIASADYHHVKNKLLATSKRNYTEKYPKQKAFEPSCLVFYIGINQKATPDENLHLHSIEIYKNRQCPSQLLFYMCCPSKTEAWVAPGGCENIFLLVPIALRLPGTEKIGEKYFYMIFHHSQKNFNESIRENIMYKKNYCINEFVNDYNSYKGNAYGLPNTLMQTATLKLKIKKMITQDNWTVRGTPVCRLQLFQEKLPPDYFKKN